MNEPRRSLMTDNQFKFVCPIFGAEVELRGCFTLRNAWAKGQAPAVRKGCQACMSASKCPVIAILKEIDNKDGDIYYSAEPKKGRVSDYVLKSIAPIVVTTTTLNTYGDMPEDQRAAIINTNGLAGFAKFKGMGGATLEDIGVTVREDDHKKKGFSRGAAPKKIETISATENAAITGDLTAALNAAMQGEAA